MKTPRDRRLYALLFVLTVTLGFASRHYGADLPRFVSAYAGDALWAAAAFFAIGVLLNQTRTVFVGALALGVSYFVELSQLYRAPWIDGIRGTTIGALFLGSGFLWSDLACYAAGVVLACVVDLVIRAVRIP